MNIELRDWSYDRLQSLPCQHLLALAQHLSGSLVHNRVLLGRCLLVISGNRAYEECGANSAVHYASLVLHMDQREARECLLVATRLEPLPRISEAVEAGLISWRNLQLILQRATPDDEARWLRLAQDCSAHELQKIVRREACGGQRQPQMTRLEILLPAELMVLFQRVLRDLSQEAGKRLSAVDALECMLAEHLAGSPFPEPRVWEKLQDEARRDLEAQQQNEAWPEDEVPEAPLEALACRESEIPGASHLQLVQSEPATWENDQLRFNPSSRQLTPAQRREILRRDGYRCSVPDCPHVLWLQVHHLVYYCEGGVTLPENLIAVCASYVTSVLCEAPVGGLTNICQRKTKHTFDKHFSWGPPVRRANQAAASLPGAGKAPVNGAGSG